MTIEFGTVTEQTKSFGPVETIDSLGVLAKFGT
jgi:hypothetical protein